jgi:phage head maturation protease
MHKKSLTGVEIKDETKGEVRAVFATMNVKDKDDDVTRPGAFGSQRVVISAYSHKSWEGALPVGKGTISEQGDQAVLDAQFFMDTTHGRDTFNTVRALGDQGEWSYGYDVLESEPGDHEGKSVRVLKSMKVYEVSPVLRGAGEGTRTVSAKQYSDGCKAYTQAERDAMAKSGEAMPDGSYPIKTRDDVQAAIDTVGMGKAPADDIKAHIIKRADALGCSDMLPKTWTSGKSLNDQITFAVGAVQEAVDSASRVAALRAEKGKALSNVNRNSLEELYGSVRVLKKLLKQEDEVNTADDSQEIHNLWLKSIAANLEG